MASPPPQKPPRPVTLKLKTSNSTAGTNALPSLHASVIGTTSLATTQSGMSPPPATPSSGGTKIILKRSQPPTPAAVADGPAASMFSLATVGITPAPATAASTPMVTMTKKGRVSRPTAKKRARDQEESEDELLQASGTLSPYAAATLKRPKLILKKSYKRRTASIVLKQAGKEVPPRSAGEGYDSEEEDREIDPVIEEEFVLRMPPGEHCDYLRRMVDERRVGMPVKDGGADFHMKWLPGVERRALVTVRGTHFVGVLVDLPTITEGMKTWDKRNFMKSADICQMLLVFAQVADEATAKAAPLPPMLAKDFRWPHGLTPPMHDCIHRRFRKRLSKKEIKDKEAELQRLLQEDRIAIESKWELIDDGRDAPGAGGGTQDDDTEMLEDGDEDAYGEVDAEYYDQLQQQQDAAVDGAEVDEIDESELEAMFMNDGDEDEGANTATVVAEAAAANAAESGGVSGAASAPDAGVTSVAANGKPSGTPAEETEASDADGDEDDEDDDDDDDDDMDEDELERVEQAKGVREDINELKKQLQQLEKNLAGTQNTLLRKRIEENKKRVMSELRLKQASIGEVDEE